MNQADHHHPHRESIVWFRRDKDVGANCSISQHRHRDHLRIPTMADFRKLTKIQTTVA